MTEIKNFDFETKEKKILMSEFTKNYSWVEESYVSPDGEKIASIVQVEEEVFSVVCADGVETKKWEDADKIWHLNFLPDNRLYAFFSNEDAWTVGIDNILFEETFDYVWKPLITEDGKNIAVSVNNDGEYAMALNGKAWEKGFANITNTALSKLGDKTAACVQVKSAGEGEIFKFQEGLFTVAIDGKPWNTMFVNVWDISFSDDSSSVAAEVRTNLYDYTIAVDDKVWAGKYKSIWKPIFRPNTKSVIVPAQLFDNGKWGLIEDDKIIWEARFFQCWHTQFSPDGNKLAAIVSPDYGKWTVAVDNKVWNNTFDSYVTDIAYSANSETIAAIYMNGNQQSSLIVNDKPWLNKFDVIEEFSISAKGDVVVAVAKKDELYNIVVNDKIFKSGLKKAWKPVFNEDGTKVIIKTLNGDTYYRNVYSVSEIL